MRVRALKKTYYNKSDRMPGDIFEMDDRESVDVKVLTALGTIEVVKEEEQKPEVSVRQPLYQRTAIEPDPEPSSERKPEPSSDPMTTEGNTLTDTPRRTYRRRDMRAEK